jgi:hypothetical protein
MNHKFSVLVSCLRHGQASLDLAILVVARPRYLVVARPRYLVVARPRYLVVALKFTLPLRSRAIKMGLTDLPAELLVSIIIDHVIPENWKYYSEGRWILNLRLLCSKPLIFLLLFHFDVIAAEFFFLFQNCLTKSFHAMHSTN